MDENCYIQPIEKAVTIQQIQGAVRAILSVGGMACPNCAMRVHNSLIALGGVYRADVYLEFALADIFYDSQRVSMETLKQAVQRAGTAVHHNYYALVIAAD